MGVLSLFCCSDSTEDNEDKMQQQPQSSHSQQNRPISRQQQQSQKNNQMSNGLKSKNHSSSSSNSLPIATNENNNNNNKTTNNNNSKSNNKNNQQHLQQQNQDEILPSKELNHNEKLQNRKNTKKDLLDDDHSINETDTITNTNEDSNNHTPKSSQNVPQELTDNNHNKILNAGDIIAQVSPNEQPAPIPNQSQQQHQPPPQQQSDEVDTDVDEYYEDDDMNSNNSTLDLTRLQTGQAHNEETGSLLGHKPLKFQQKKCLILDLDETLVHSSFKYLRTADFVIPVEIDNQIHHVYVIKRPGVDEFLQKVGKWFEVVVFTASVSKYGDPLLDKLDFNKSVHHRLFRDSCYNYQGNFIKNLSQIGRPLKDTIIIDNSPASYIFHPQHSIPISSWFSDTHDNELLDLLPFLEDLAKPVVDDVALVLDISL
ncbi:hypothetical protein KGF54_002539 [Candida jiufengensis]|uniref:uncharacterized protein n=1 Tax=Candida jiufengensis TaxID=497108 RepID=UPI0022246AE2|nr:uncharacterized protein KGF54_002539 [Candida jiufengensis]KAI5953168.1 hypothetical protein KGF54_002539 [Candida jiufengensis]